jgi:DMSO/TMAO reductase YedYZ molybdopterin-dependent catalytic subunit
MKKYYLFALFAIVTSFLLRPVLTNAQDAPKEASVKVTGEVITPLELKLADLQQFKQTDVTRKDRDGNDHVYSGVVLSDLLQKAGATLGKDLRGENLTKYILVEASDGYQVIFALAELDKGFTDRTIILAMQMDGKPLPAGDGPFRIIVQDEKKPARCIKQVTAIKVMFAK